MKVYFVEYHMNNLSYPETIKGGIYDEDQFQEFARKYPGWVSDPRVSVTRRELNDISYDPMESFDHGDLAQGRYYHGPYERMREDVKTPSKERVVADCLVGKMYGLL